MKLTTKLFLLILFLAVLLRFTGLYPGYPFHPDEPLSYGSASQMILNNNLDPMRYDYPSLTALIHYTFFKFFFIPSGVVKEFITSPAGFIQSYFIERQSKNILYKKIFGSRGEYAMQWSRFVNSLFAVFTVIAFYIITRKMFNTSTALIAELLLATNYRHVFASHLALTDVINALMTLLSVYSCYIVWKRDTKNWYILSGIILGLSLSTKFQYFAFLSFIFSQIFLFWQNPKTFLQRLRFSLLTICIACLVFVALNPYLFIKWHETFYMVGRSMARYGSGINKFMFFPYIYLFRLDIGILPTIFFFIGILISFFTQFKKTLFIFPIIIAIFYTFTYYSQGGGFLRNFVSAIPLMLIFSAIGITYISHLFSQRIQKYVLIFLISITIAQPTYDSFILSVSYTKPWNEDQIAETVKNLIPKNASVITIPPIRFPDDKNIAILNDGFAPERDFSVAEVAEKNIDYIAIELGGIYKYLTWWSGKPMSEILPYWDNPGRYLMNTVYGLPIEDVARDGIAFIAKPYQAQDNVYLIAKVPKFLGEPITHSIISYSFPKQESFSEGFKALGLRFHMVNPFSFDGSTGYKGNGSVKIGPSEISSSEVVRLSSLPIKIDPLTYYEVKAWVKIDGEITEIKRDAFLRLDFYDNKDDALKSRNRKRLALSSRIYGTNWIKKEIIALSPSNALYMTISFQEGDYGKNPNMWIDDILLSKIDYAPDIIQNSKAEEIEQKIRADYIYPKSI